MRQTLALVDPFDRSGGSGSRHARDDWTDEVSIYDNEWGSQAATTFNPTGEDGQGNPIPESKQAHLERLYAHHNGKGESTRRTTIRRSHIKNDTNTFMCVLELPTYQRERVVEIIDNLDLSSNNFGSTKYEKLILTVCSLVSDEALSNQADPSVDERLFLTDSFRDLMDAVEMSSSEHRRLRVKVREKSAYFD